MTNLAQEPRATPRGGGIGRLASHLLIGIVAFAIGSATRQPEPAQAASLGAGPSAATGVTGIGGVFFKSEDPAALLDWYRTHLGIASEDWGGFAFQWQEKERPEQTGYTVWSAFPETTDYFGPGDHTFMLNFRVDDLVGLIAALRAEGVEVAGEIEQHPNGKFAWILDLEGRRVELWEPVASSEDPYLQ